MKKARRLTIEQLIQGKGSAETAKFTSPRELIQQARVWTRLTVVVTALAILFLISVAVVAADLVPSCLQTRLRNLHGTSVFIWGSTVFSIVGAALQGTAGILFVIWTSSARTAAQHIGLLPIPSRKSSRGSYYNYYLDSIARIAGSVADVWDLLAASISGTKARDAVSKVWARMWGASYLVASALSLVHLRHTFGKALWMLTLLLWMISDVLSLYIVLKIMRSEEQFASAKRNIGSSFVDVADSMSGE